MPELSDYMYFVYRPSTWDMAYFVIVGLAGLYPIALYISAWSRWKTSVHTRFGFKVNVKLVRAKNLSEDSRWPDAPVRILPQKTRCIRVLCGAAVATAMVLLCVLPTVKETYFILIVARHDRPLLGWLFTLCMLMPLLGVILALVTGLRVYFAPCLINVKVTTAASRGQYYLYVPVDKDKPFDRRFGNPPSDPNYSVGNPGQTSRMPEHKDQDE